MNEYVRFAGETLVGLSWPLVLLLFIVLLRKPLANAMDRITEFNVLGNSGKLSEPPLQHQTQPLETRDGARFLEYNSDQYETPPGPDVAATGAVEPSESELAEAWRELYEHEVNYRQIFGTQVKLLEAAALGPVPPEMAQSVFFHQHQTEVTKEYPAYLPTAQQFMGFLLVRGLVAVENGRYAITDKGRRFLDYITTQALPPRAW